MSGICYIVGTPIGNLKDITYRAVETLSSVDVIAAEDTRTTRVLLEHYGIKKPMLSYHKHNEKESVAVIQNTLKEGKSVAIVTDCGMPCISDPGAVLIKALRENGFDIKVIPGATALASAVSLSGVVANGFVFLGFLPEKAKDKRTLLSAYKNVKEPLVLYCAPHDLEKTTAFLLAELGNRPLVSVKEITKIYETVYEGTLQNPAISNQKGEFVLIVGGAREEEKDAAAVETALRRCIQRGMSKTEAVKQVSAEKNLPKNFVYEISLTVS
jgi:16S rRNA (cytidine1402-2'-O)-methyltransferase